MNFKKLAQSLCVAVLILIAPALASAQQNLLLQTSLAAAVPVAPSTSPFGSSQTFIQVAAVPTGVTGIQLNPTTTLNQQNQWQVYIDRELMNVVSINGTVIQVQRGVSGTVASPHANATMVLFGRASWFYVNDPGGTPGSGAGVAGSSCVPATILVSPYLNVRTGGQWLCSSVTNTWVPGWNNSGGDFNAVTANVAAAAGTITPSGPIFQITGAGAITGFNIPLGFNGTAVGGGCFNAISAAGATWTWTAAGNIALAGTGTALKVFQFCWNANTSKWMPANTV